MVEQQVLKSYKLLSKFSTSIKINDTRWENMWYMVSVVSYYFKSVEIILHVRSELNKTQGGKVVCDDCSQLLCL